MTEEFKNLVQNIYKANEQCYKYTDDRIKRIKNIFYKNIIKNSYDLSSLINNINKFFSINISREQLKQYIIRKDYGYKLVFNINNFNEEFVIKYPFSRFDKIRILYNSRYQGIMTNRNFLVFDYISNKNTRNISKQLEQYLDLENIKLKYDKLLKKQEDLNKEIEKIKNIILTNGG